MRTAAACAAALVLSLTAACSSSGTGNTPAAPHLSKHTSCAEWSGWSAYYRVSSAGAMADGMGAYDKSVAFHRIFARNLLAACRSAEHMNVAMVAAGLATLDRTDFS